MNWDARSAWVYEGTIPDPAKAARHGIEVVYVDPRSANAAAAISTLRAAGLTPGIYTSPNWEDALGGAAFADWTNGVLNSLLHRVGAAEAPPYMADLEGRDVAWQTAFLDRYRQHQPGRPSSATVAPFQGGYVPTAHLAARGFHLYPQLYYGDPLPDGRLPSADPAGVLLEMARQGFPAAMLHPFYDGAALPSDARDGCVFTLERIPV